MLFSSVVSDQKPSFTSGKPHPFSSCNVIDRRGREAQIGSFGSETETPALKPTPRSETHPVRSDAPIRNLSQAIPNLFCPNQHRPVQSWKSEALGTWSFPCRPCTPPIENCLEAERLGPKNGENRLPCEFCGQGPRQGLQTGW